MNLKARLDNSFPKSKFGFYYKENGESLSYPDDGYNFCFDIEDESYWFQHRNKIINSLVEKHQPEGTFADIGGGNGVVTKALESIKNLEPVLIEPGKQGCINATKREVTHIVQATVEELEKKDLSFDAAGLFDVIEHIAEPVEFLENVKKILKPKSRVFITVPAYKKLWSAEDVNAGHFRRYNLNLAKTQLNAAGFRIIDSTYFFSALPVPIFIARALKKKGVAKREDYILPSNIMGNALKWTMEVEKSRLKQNKRIPFGSSLFLVAEINQAK